MKTLTNTRAEYRAYRKSGGGTGQSEELIATSRDEALAEALDCNERAERHDLSPVTSIAEYTGPICTGTATADGGGFRWQ